MTDWDVEIVDVEAEEQPEADATTHRRRKRFLLGAILALLVLFIVACIGTAGALFMADMWPLGQGWGVAHTTTALIGQDMRVVVVELDQPVILERAVLVLNNGEEVESVTPTEETVASIAFFVAMEGGSAVPNRILVRHQAGNLDYQFNQETSGNQREQ